MADLGAMTVRIKADLSNLSANLKRAGQSIRTFASTVATSVGYIGRIFTGLGHTVGRLVTTISRHMRRMALVIGAELVLATREFVKFETQLANVSTMLDDQSMRYMPQYAAQLKQFAIEFGEGTATLSKGLYDILSASIAPAKAMDVLAVSVRAAKAGMTDTAVAADVITTVLNSYRLNAEQATDVSDLLFATVKRGKTTFAELAPNIGMVASTAALAGLSLEELGASIATMTRAGMRTEIAVTALRGLLNSFISPTDEAKEAAATLGITLDTTALRGGGLVKVLQQLRNASTEQLAALIPNIRAFAGFASAVQQLDGYLVDYDFMLNRTGRTQEAYAKMTATLGHSFRRLWQLVKVTMVESIAPFADEMKSVTDRIVANAQQVRDWTAKVTTYVQALLNVMKVRLAGVDTQHLMLQLSDLVVRAIEQAVLGVIELEKHIAALPVYWKAVVARIKEAHAAVAEFADSITNLDVVFKWLGGRQETYADAAKRLRTEAAELNSQVDEELEKLYGKGSSVKKFFHDLRAEQKKLWAEYLAQKTRAGQESMADIAGGFAGNLPAKQAAEAFAGAKATGMMQQAADRWKDIWAEASSSIASSMSGAFADIMEDARNVGEVMTNLARQIQRAVSQAVFSQLLVGPIFGAISDMGIPLTKPGGQVSPVQTTGLPVYAQHGAFVPRGSDRIPAMISPGEAVVTDRILAAIADSRQPQPVTINVQAIDAAGTYQFLYQNRRAIASMMQETQSQNHPIRRGGK